MGREVRRVPAGWKHPKDDRTGQYMPLLDGFNARLAEWMESDAQWRKGLCRNYGWERNNEPEWEPIDPKHAGMTYEEYNGAKPDQDHYVPDWPEAERTHYQMYEDTSEGTPISPVMDSPEALARWLTDNRASAFGGMTASYEAWLNVCRGGWAPSMVIKGNVMTSGVAFSAAPLEPHGEKAKGQP
jgi:hypothetical protein